MKKMKMIKINILVWTISLWLILWVNFFHPEALITSDFLPICCDIDSTYKIGFDICVRGDVVHQELIRPDPDEIQNVQGICVMCHVAAFAVMYIGVGTSLFK